jgi:hypothetical protein
VTASALLLFCHRQNVLDSVGNVGLLTLFTTVPMLAASIYFKLNKSAAPAVKESPPAPASKDSFQSVKSLLAEGLIELDARYCHTDANGIRRYRLGVKTAPGVHVRLTITPVSCTISNADGSDTKLIEPTDFPQVVREREGIW